MKFVLLRSPRSERLPGPSSAACKNDDDVCNGIFSVLPPSVEANERSALSPLGVDASSSSSDVPVPVFVPLGDVAKVRPCFSNFCRRTDFRSSSSFIAFTLKSPLKINKGNFSFKKNARKELFDSAYVGVPGTFGKNVIP